METLNIRPAEKRDCVSIVKLIRELALFENMLDQAKATVDDLERDGFDTNPPYFQCLVAEMDLSKCQEEQNAVTHETNDDCEVKKLSREKVEVIGYALYFHKYSTWEGKGLHLEDLYVSPAYRKNGVGTKLLRRLGKIATEGDYCRLTLECLDWNKSAIDYYKNLEAVDLTEKEGWHVFRFKKSNLPKLAGYEFN